jgi:hypothetical protein
LTASPSTPWQPPADEELSCFKPGGQLPARPTTLEFEVPIYAFVFGISRALESLYFPMYEIRARLIDGELYLASVPSAMAERELDAQLGRLRDSGLRFTRGVRAIWERAIKKEVEEYNERMAGFAPSSASDREVADGLAPLRRTRANQWFAATRAIFAPTVMLQHGLGETPVEEALEVSREALGAVRHRGTDLMTGAVLRVGARLARNGRIATPEDVWWLDLDEVRDALHPGQGSDSGSGGRSRPHLASPTAVGEEPGLHLATSATGGVEPGVQSLVEQRKSDHQKMAHATGPDALGPALPPDAPRLYLLREILTLIA